MTGTLSFMQGQALNLFNGDLSSLSLTPAQPQSMLRHKVSCTCLSFPSLIATIWIQTLPNSSLNHCSAIHRVPTLCQAPRYVFCTPLLPSTEQPCNIALSSRFLKRKCSLRKLTGLDQHPLTRICTEFCTGFSNYVSSTFLHCLWPCH